MIASRHSQIALWAPLLIVCSTVPALGQDPTPPSAQPEDRRGPGYSANLGRFGGAIVLSEAGRGALEGNQDAVDDALRAPTTPEFLVGLAMFDGSMRVGSAVAARTPLTSRLGGVLKQNLVLAGALTATSAIQVDLNGFRYTDALRGDFSRLRGASVNIGDLDGQSLGITMGAFAAAQPIWQGTKSLARRFGSVLARRLATTAVLKAGLAVAPVPGTRVAALALTGVEVVLAVGDLAGLLMTAHALEEPLQAANEQRRRRGAVASAEERAAEAARREDLSDLEEALLEVRRARGRERAESYTSAASEDMAMIRRLREGGADPEVFNTLAGRALGDYGPGLALPAQSALLLDELETQVAAGRLTRAALERHTARVRAAQAEAAEARDASYAEEDRAYAALLAAAQDPEARALIEAAREEAEIEAEIERSDLRVRAQPAASELRSAITLPIEGAAPRALRGFTTVLDEGLTEGR